MKRTLLALPFLAFILISCDSGPGSNESPSVSFSYTPQNPRAGTQVEFTADASDPDGNIQTYTWEFPDGGTKTGVTTTYTFPSPGPVGVTLRVEDNRDGESTVRKTLEVRQRYTSAEITAVELQSMPFTQPDGSGWDSFSGPDPYYEAFVGDSTSSTSLTTSENYEDISQSDLPLPYSETSFVMPDLSNRYTIAIYDYNPVRDDQWVGGVSYSLENEVGDYPETYTIEYGETRLQLTINWLP